MGHAETLDTLSPKAKAKAQSRTEKKKYFKFSLASHEQFARKWDRVRRGGRQDGVSRAG